LNEILTIISALNLIFMPVSLVNETDLKANMIISDPTYEVVSYAPNYMQGILLFETPSALILDASVPTAGAISGNAAVGESELAVLQKIQLEAEAEVSKPEPTMTLLGTYKLTAYCPCKKCCGKSPSHPAYGITASGEVAEEGITVAMSGYPFGTRIYIEGIGERIVQDRGGSVTKQVVDIFASTHEGCYNPLYNRKAQVWLIED